MSNFGIFELPNQPRAGSISRRVTTTSASLGPGRLGRGKKERESISAPDGLATRRA